MTPEQYKEWLASLKVGDPVAVKHSYYQTFTYSIEKIVKTTPTRQIETEKVNGKFKNGEIYDRSSWSSRMTKLVPLTQEIRDYIETEKLKSWMKSVDTTKLSLNQLRWIRSIVTREVALSHSNESTFNPSCSEYDGELGCCKSGKACRKEGCEKEVM